MSSRSASLPESAPRAREMAPADLAASERSVRVCMIISSFRPLIGGAETVTERLTAELRRRGADVLILTRRYPGLEAGETVSGVPVRRLGHPSRSKLGALTFALHALWLLATELRSYRIVHVQNPDVPLLTGFLARLLLRRKLFVTIQSDPKLVFDRERWSRRVRLSLIARLADVVAVQNEEMGRELEEAGVPAQRTRILPNSVDTSRFAPPTRLQRQRARGRLDIAEAEVVYLFVGRLVALKRVDVLLRAWSAHEGRSPGSRLLIVGDGPDRTTLERLASYLGVERVRFAGSTEDVLPYLHAADVLVHPSSIEGLSLALLEGMATGLPAVVSDLPQNLAVVEHGKSGLVFPLDDVEALGDRLAEVLDATLRERLGREAAGTVRGGFSLEGVARRHLLAYRAHDDPRGAREAARPSVAGRS